MSVYITVAAVRIQTWIGRSTALADRRGASALLNQTIGADTLTAAVHRRIPDAGIRSNTEAAAIDGVAQLVHDDDAPAGHRVAEVLLEHLAVRLPGAEFEIRWGSYPSWDEAITELAPGGSAHRMGSLAAPPEFPFAERCAVTGTDLAVEHAKDKDGKPRPVGIDAATRAVAAGYRTGDRPKPGTGAERRLGEQLSLDTTADLESLAELGPASHKTNHLATAFLDGNNVGAAFREVESRRRPALARALKDATWGSLVTATHRVQEICGSPTELAVIPHVVGGDDVLVTMPAAAGPAFTRAFIDEFGRAMSELGLAPADRPLSMSAGLVIAHHSQPFSAVVRTADGLLARAKAGVRGARPSLATAELTSESTDPVGTARVWAIGAGDHDLNRYLDDLRVLSTCAKSARQELAGAARSGPHDIAIALIGRQLNRSGLELSASVRTNPGLLADLIQLSRWWHE